MLLYILDYRYQISVKASLGVKFRFEYLWLTLIGYVNNGITVPLR